MVQMYLMFRRFFGDQRGISAIEYAVLAAIILVAIAIALGTFGDQIGNWFSGAADAVQDELPGSMTGDGGGGGGS